MAAVDLDKLETAIKYVQRIADGCNPVNNVPAGCLTVAYSEEMGKETTMPTAKGRELGIYTEVRSMPGNTYLAVIYNRKAQEFVVQNLEIMVNGETADDTKA